MIPDRNPKRGMPKIPIEITRFADDWQPGWVEFVLVDVRGERHHFIEKVPVVTQRDLDATSNYPVVEWVECVVLDAVPEQGSVRVDVSRPWGLESTEGRTEFEMAASQVR